MSSRVVKKLQKLHLNEGAAGLEDIVGLGGLGLVDQDATSLGIHHELQKTPILQRRLSLGSAGLTDSVILRKEKAKVAATEKYYYKSPCPEKENMKNLLSPAKGRSSSLMVKSSLVDTAAEFCKGGTVDGWNCKVFVGNVSYRVKDKEFRECFELFGKVIRASICKDKKTKRSRGRYSMLKSMLKNNREGWFEIENRFGFVIFASRESAERAINAPDDQLNYDGRLMKVCWAERKRKGKSKEVESEEQSLEELARSFLENEEIFKIMSKELESGEERHEDPMISKLNDDILLHIFSYLQLTERIQIERVCKRWQNVSRQTWKSLTSLSFKGMFRAFEGAGGLTDRILYSILKRGCHNLLELDLSGSPFLLTSFGLHSIADICTELHVLDLSNVAVTNQNLKEIGLKCSHLETLILGRCKDFGEKGLWWFLKEAKNLKNLEVKDNVRVTGKSFWMLSDTCQVLNLENCVKISDNGLINISTKAPKLVTLDITNCLLVTDMGLAKICTHNQLLRKLVVCGAGNAVTSDGLKAIGQLKDLEFLNISQNQSLTDSVIQHLVKHCTKLRYLNLEACHGQVTDVGVKSVSSLAYLEELNISYIADITDSSIEHLAASSSLRSLVCRACSKISNEGVVSLLTFAGSSLMQVDMSGCYTIDDNLVNDEMLNRRYESLSELKINLGGTSMTQEGANALQKKIGNCQVVFEKRYNSRLRNDYDPTSFAPFYSSDEDGDDDDFEDTRPFHPFSAKGYTVRSSDLQGHSLLQSHDTVEESVRASDLQDHTLRRHPMSHEMAEDFLDADDPALLDELEEQFMFD